DRPGLDLFAKRLPVLITGSRPGRRVFHPAEIGPGVAPRLDDLRRQRLGCILLVVPRTGDNTQSATRQHGQHRQVTPRCSRLYHGTPHAERPGPEAAAARGTRVSQTHLRPRSAVADHLLTWFGATATRPRSPPGVSGSGLPL